MNALNSKQYVRPGDLVMLEMPFTEVCMHLGVAGKVMTVLVTEEGAQLLDEKRKPVSFPITLSEAGIYTESGDLHYVPMDNVKGYKRRPKSTVVLMVEGMRDGKPHQYCSEMHAESCIERLPSSYQVSFESDEIGRRYRIKCPQPTRVGTNINGAPAARVVKLAQACGVPFVLED